MLSEITPIISDFHNIYNYTFEDLYRIFYNFGLYATPHQVAQLIEILNSHDYIFVQGHNLKLLKDIMMYPRRVFRNLAEWFEEMDEKKKKFEKAKRKYWSTFKFY